MGLFLICIDRIKVEDQQSLTGFEPTIFSQSGEEKDNLDHSGSYL